MNLIDLVKSSAGNLLRNKGRTLLTIIAIFIGSFTIYLTLGINTGVNNYMDLQLETVGNDQLLAVYKSDGTCQHGSGQQFTRIRSRKKYR